MIIIYSQIAQKWLKKLKYKYSYVEKNVFIDGYEKLDMIIDCKHFFKVIEKLKLYLVEFNKTNQIILKIYPSNYVVRGDK